MHLQNYQPDKEFFAYKRNLQCFKKKDFLIKELYINCIVKIYFFILLFYLYFYL